MTAMLLTVTCIMLALGMVSLALLVYKSRREVQEQARMRHACEEALEKLQSEHQNFVYVASHDLHEPIRAIEGFSQLLFRRHSEELSPGASELLGFVRKGADQISDMLARLLEYSRAGAAVHSKSVQSLETLLQHGACAAAECGGARLVLTHGVLPDLNCDARCIESTFRELLVNTAVHAVADGEACVHVTARLDGGVWQVSVDDDGQGIPDTEFERVFEPFQRASTARTRSAGMGLAICRRHIERHGGSIRADTVAKGARIVFTLPAD